MIYQLSQQRTVTISGKKLSQVFSYCWKGAAPLVYSNELQIAIQSNWRDQLEMFDPTGSTTSRWVSSQVLQLPDNRTSLAVNSPYCDIILTAVDLNNVNAPCTVKVSTSYDKFQHDVGRAIARLIDITPPSTRVLITNAVIRVKEA